ncbi:hypothetical protein [Nonomuraea sp. NPDC001699]
MEWQQFALAIIGHLLSWPALVLVVILVFRKPLAELLGRVISYEGLGQKVTFGEDLAKVEAEVEALVQADATVESQSDPLDHERAGAPVASSVENLRAFGGAGAVIQAWGTVEKAIGRLVTVEYVSSALLGRYRNPNMVLGWGAGRLISPLIEVGILPPTLGPVLKDLERLRNDVAHGAHTPTDGEAITFALTAAGLVAVLDGLRLSIERRFPDLDEE